MDLPPAPTPPVSSGVGPNSDRTANLLNLLKFSHANSMNAAQQHQQQQKQQHQQQQQLQQQQQQHHQLATMPALPQPQPQQQLHHNSHNHHHHEDETDEEEPSHHHQPQESGQYQSHHQSPPNQYQQLHHQQSSLPLQSQFPTRIHQPAPAAADPTGLLAALMRGAQDEESKTPAPEPQAQPLPQPLPQALPQPQPQAQATNPFSSGSPSADTRSYLLNLLNRPKPSQTDQPMLVDATRSSDHTPQSPEPSPEANRYYAHQQQAPNAYQSPPQYQSTESFTEVPHPANKVNSFSYPPTQEAPADMSAIYQHLMGSLAQSPPQNSSAHGSAAPPFHILKKEQGSPAGSQRSQRSQHFEPARIGSDHSPVVNPAEHTRHKPDRTASLHSHQSYHSAHHSAKQTPQTSEFDSYISVEKSKETVSEAVSDLAGPADRDAREALERAEHPQERSDSIEDLGNASYQDREDTEWNDGPEIGSASRSFEKHLDEDSRDEIDRTSRYVSPDGHAKHYDSQATEDAVENNNVADSWESADQDEIVVIEEADGPSVKVFNFPMKPWISITLQEETTEPRPQFRDESIMDIARLKKEFDQIDRNLYTASQTYMTYGMSKQGGLRVIRQDDGKDAKVFTDTKDRIFNVAMSVTPPEHEGVPREAIIGTGISGTVYWVQIKDGDKDHIEDAHLEQYGFALPPINSQEGDAPGGALKTRARASTIHPEYFAVGRGKSIHFVWPAYIMENNLFKPGHDRVADTETLLQQCSLKINTGKAGKDFTFSQDDTVVVSLDKSGRVKFWDVRDLTAVKEGSNPRSPLPARSSVEVKEPLMTLASTPEGEKAWPTSVLLLDKQRPYQKRCALRYMIVGMKQNHTLQLWDLALGKPVQEFNLPHSKESDAVCSVTYHPASGMIVIGHPTRNSVYFAHLSAPKYNLKSVSQAEYIQRLIAQDPSIPPPDSTAVISGVREYSFANRGILRSLDILSNPAMLQDADEPTLFELYAMHSKGVACLLIKQCELGWSKDNKVLNPVDAVTERVVVVSKLKTPQPPETSPGASSNAPVLGDSSQIRIATRSATKDSPVLGTPTSNEPTQRVVEAVTPVKAKNELKEAETPVQSSKENQNEKPERKSRKKKGSSAKETESLTTNGTATVAKPDGGKANGMTAEAFDSAVNGIETRIGSVVTDSLKVSLKNLHGKIDESARVRDETFNHHQLKLLDMVSEVLNENTQKVLESLINQQFTDVVIPSIGEKTGKAVTDLLQNKFQPSITSAVQKEIQTALPHALNRSLRSGDFINTISDRVSSAVSTSVQEQVLNTLTQRLTPTFTNIATQSAQRVAGELHQQYTNQFEQMKAQHVADASKIDQLMSYVTRLTDMVSTMAASQSSLQAEFLKFKQQPVELPGASGIQGHPIAGPVHNPGPHGYGNNGLGSHHGGYAPSHVPSHAPSHVPSHAPSHVPSQAASQTQSFMNNNPQYMRGSQHMPSPQGSGVASDHVGPASNVNALATAYAHQMNKSDAEADGDMVQRIRVIEQAIQEGRLQDAMIQWIQSGREEEIFRRCLSRYPPNKFENLPQLILLVVIATISKDLKPNPRLKEEIEWIEMAVRSFGENMPNYVSLKRLGTCTVRYNKMLTTG